MKKTVFIAIPFNPVFDKIYERAIHPAFCEMKLHLIRVDKIKGNGNITTEIEEGIKKADLVFADLTSCNANVFYEVGFAWALHKNIIPVTQNGDEVPFDLRPRRYIHYENSENGLALLKSEIKAWVEDFLQNPDKYFVYPKVFVHGTKHSVPKGGEFWNDLCENAEKRFYLLGRSNRSWINKTEDQCIRLADSIVKIISNGGSVKIVSAGQSQIVQQHRNFYKNFLAPRLTAQNLTKEFKRNFCYGVMENTNYEAVITDSRIVILPTMNTEDFRHESLVMEVEGAHLPEFKNYLADYERLFNDGQCEVIDLTNGKKK